MFQQLTAESALVVFTRNIFNNCESWIAEHEAEPVAFVALDGNTLDRLYVHPDFQRLGIGKQLLQFCLEQRPEGLRLFTHQKNVRARQFYENFGFKAVRFGISPPPESVPDVEYIYGTPNCA